MTAQQYAAFLVAFIAAVLWHPSFKTVVRFCLAAALGAALLFNGSRTWFLGAVAVLLIYLLRSHSRILAYSLFGLSTVALGGLLMLNFNPYQVSFLDYSSSRIVATASALVTGEDTPERAGLANVNFRLSVYDGAISELRSASFGQLVLGHGTASGGNVVMRVFPRAYKVDTLDPNRVLHNEWLRSLYEWGVGGFCLVVTVLLSIVIGLVKRSRLRSAYLGSTIALSFAPAFFLAFSTSRRRILLRVQGTVSR